MADDLAAFVPTSGYGNVCPCRAIFFSGVFTEVFSANNDKITP